MGAGRRGGVTGGSMRQPAATTASQLPIATAGQLLPLCASYSLLPSPGRHGAGGCMGLHLKQQGNGGNQTLNDRGEEGNEPRPKWWVGMGGKREPDPGGGATQASVPAWPPYHA